LQSLIRNPKEFWAGVMFTVLGVIALVIGQDYTMGTAGKMGPGYFPTALGGILTVLGLIAVVRSFIKGGETLDKFALKPAFLVLFSVFLFGILMRTAGMVIAVMALVIVGGLASNKYTWKANLALAIGGALFCSIVFVKGLGVPMPLFGTWFGN